MFRGNHPTRIDDKGRLKVPADFKRVLDESYGQKFYITSRDGKVAEIYPLEEWEKFENKIAQLPSMHPGVKKFLNTTSYWGQEVEIDGQGRLLMPGLLRDSAALKGDVAVVGSLNHLEVRVLDDYKQWIEQNPITPEDETALAQLGI
jgi:MraZ protein